MHRRKIIEKQNTYSAEAERIAEELNVSPLLIGVLLTRGFTGTEKIKNFLYGADKPFFDPFLMKDMEKVVTRIVKAINEREKITVYGDYDVDGITASSLLYSFLEERGAVVDVYIPKRSDEGYGLNDEAIMGLYEQGTRLLLTVDCGISGVNEVAKAPKDMDIIITDHHVPPEELPKAFGIVNPHQKDCPYPFKDLAGVGVAFKVCQGIFKAITKEDEAWSDKLEFVAMGTVADIVPLVGENRELVRMGLRAIKRTKSKGLVELMKIAGVYDKPITGDTIGFALAPRLNAVGRLEHALSGVKLLTTRDSIEAKEIATKLNEENILRQEISNKITVEAEEMLAKQDKIETAIVLAKDDWHAGVIGIVASRLVDRYHLPTILITTEGCNGKGSCRSIESLNLYEALNACKDYLIQFGGHKQAAGLTLEKDKIEEFRKVFCAQVKKMLSPEDFIPKIVPDYFVPEDKVISVSTVKDLALLEPCGSANSFPVFAFKDTELKKVYTMGAMKKHLRSYFDFGKTSYKTIFWNEGVNKERYYEGATGTLAFVPKINSFNGIDSVDLVAKAFNDTKDIIDFRSANEERKKLLKTILQKDEKTVIYLHDTASFPVECRGDKVELLNYKDKISSSDISNVVLYDLPPTDFFQKETFPLRNLPNATLILLYNNKDLDKAMAKINDTLPTREIMGRNYKYLIGLIKAQSIVKIDALLDHEKTRDCYFTKDILQVFSELGFISMDGEQIAFKSKERNELTNSPMYCSMLDKRRTEESKYKNLLTITGKEISQIW